MNVCHWIRLLLKPSVHCVLPWNVCFRFKVAWSLQTCIYVSPSRDLNRQQQYALSIESSVGACAAITEWIPFRKIRSSSDSLGRINRLGSSTSNSPWVQTPTEAFTTIITFVSLHSWWTRWRSGWSHNCTSHPLSEHCAVTISSIGIVTYSPVSTQTVFGVAL